MNRQLQNIIEKHPAYKSHTEVQSYQGFTLVRVSYRKHPDYEGGERLEAWDDNNEYLCDVEDKIDFEEQVDELLAVRDEED